VSNAVATLPKGSDPAAWSPEEKALVAAAGLVNTDANGQQTAAPRPVVAAFLQHCSRTGLDPFARQIYAIARKNRGNLNWTVQISIDGARLVAERTGKYEGQTTPEFTSDGVTWTTVWLNDEQPKAARVGVYRQGFREPLYAIALWTAYAVYQDEWEGGQKTGKQKLSAMWSKMGPLMLAKCAEMLALRKAFPQDLSGLYSTEEMDQAGAPLEVVKEAEASVPETRPQPAEPQQHAIATPIATRDWAAAIEAATTLDECAALYREAERAGELGLKVGLAGDNDDGSALSVMDLFWAKKAALQAATPPLVDVPKQAPVKRQWVREAREKTTRWQRVPWCRSSRSSKRSRRRWRVLRMMLLR
jgi:phage recombination protein Bet